MNHLKQRSAKGQIIGVTSILIDYVRGLEEHRRAGIEADVQYAAAVLHLENAVNALRLGKLLEDSDIASRNILNNGALNPNKEP